MEHALKCWPSYFQAVWEGRKPFEIRRNDRGFQAFDTVTLEEWDPTPSDFRGPPKGYTGRKVKARISYVCDFEQKPGFVVFGIDNRYPIGVTQEDFQRPIVVDVREPHNNTETGLAG